MNNIQKLLSMSAITLLVAACGAESGSTLSGLDQGLGKTVITGQVQQGNVKDAQVFLDLNDNGVLDASEPKAAEPTDAQGKFTLTLTEADAAKITPASKIVSVGGTDTLNPDVKVGLLVSELPDLTAGSATATPTATTTATATKHITPLTTLLAMAPDADTKGKLKDVLKELGGHKDNGGNDDFLIEGSSQAVIALTKSTEMVLTTLQTSSGDDKGGRDLARKAAREMARSLSGKSAHDLTDTATIATTLSSASGTAADQTPSAQLNVTGADLVAELKTGCLDVANAVKGDSGSGTLETTSGKSEVEVMTEKVKGQITNAVNTANTNIAQEIAPTGTQTTTTTKTATVAFTANITAAPLPAPLQAITVTSILPAGTTVATDAGGVINNKALVAASGISGSKVFGTYSAAGRMARITFTTSDPAFASKGGVFASLVVSFQSPPGLKAGDFASPKITQASDQKSTVDLTGKLQAALGVTFN